jgi:hypothetical protein
MKTLLFAALLAGWSPVAAQTASPPSPKGELSIVDQIKADRAKQKADEQNDSTARAWDRDADGKRPWDRKAPPAK